MSRPDEMQPTCKRDDDDQAQRKPFERIGERVTTLNMENSQDETGLDPFTLYHHELNGVTVLLMRNIRTCTHVACYLDLFGSM